MIWVLGDVAVDVVLHLTAFPQEGGDAFVDERMVTVGGCGVNIALILARLGGRPVLVANLGQDHWGDQALALLRRERVDVTGVSRDEELPTHLTVILVSGPGERTIIGHRGASARPGPDDAWTTLPGPAAVLVVSGYSLFGAARSEQARQLMDLASEAGAMVVLDLPTDLPDEVRNEVMRLLPCIDVLVVGADEAYRLCGASNPREAAERLAVPRRTVVVTLGSAGCVGVGPDGVVQAAGVDVAPVDTSGAGDAFVAALTVGLLRSLPFTETLALANGFGAAATLRSGTGSALPGPDEVAALLQQR
ncbi:carbohydrate kinase family protein [Dactylosporangium sp. NPDC048998]|uniref:carbohydrate kinase family protein n=1 Tax=Dactylosporangium sp. NPDC048998 TaxID=3363976 RepID=UPI00371C13F0